jgi:hypothetical protein
MLVLAGTVSASQPKVTEFTTSLGETYTFEEFDGSRKSEDWGIVTTEKEVVARDDTEISICITEVEKEEGDTIKFRKLDLMGDDDGPWNTDNCKTWEKDESDYQNEWRFDVRIRNQDDINFSGGSYDYQVTLNVPNLVRPGETGAVETYQYDAVELSRTEYERLQNQSSQREEDEGGEVTSGSNASKSLSREELQETINKKDERIGELEEQVQTLQDRIDNLERQIKELTADGGNRSEQAGQSPNQSDMPGSETAEERRPGFVSGLLSGIFG